MAKTTKTTQPATSSATPSPTTVKLQIAGAVFVPMLALGLWLNSKGFFS
jgi:hypothetical protein